MDKTLKRLGELGVDFALVPRKKKGPRRRRRQRPAEELELEVKAEPPEVDPLMRCTPVEV